MEKRASLFKSGSPISYESGENLSSLITDSLITDYFWATPHPSRATLLSSRS
jgi:hypothetical protein